MVCFSAWHSKIIIVIVAVSDNLFPTEPTYLSSNYAGITQATNGRTGRQISRGYLRDFDFTQADPRGSQMPKAHVLSSNPVTSETLAKICGMKSYYVEAASHI